MNRDQQQHFESLLNRPEIDVQQPDFARKSLENLTDPDSQFKGFSCAYGNNLQINVLHSTRQIVSLKVRPQVIGDHWWGNAIAGTTQLKLNFPRDEVHVHPIYGFGIVQNFSILETFKVG